MWTCPDCGRRFASAGQVHWCGPLRDLEGHFEGVDESVRATFDAFVAEVRTHGPVEVLPEATRIALHTRMSFAALMPRRHWLAGHLVLAEPVDDARFVRVTTYSKRNHVHEFRLQRPDDIDVDMRLWIAAAYQVGLQRHHQRP